MVFGLFKKKSKKTSCPVCDYGYELDIKLGDEKLEQYLDFWKTEFLQHVDCEFCKTKLALVHKIDDEEPFFFYDDEYERQCSNFDNQVLEVDEKTVELEDELEDELDDGDEKEIKKEISKLEKQKEKIEDKKEQLEEKWYDKCEKMQAKLERRNQ